jgi:hypothetical protein
MSKNWVIVLIYDRHKLLDLSYFRIKICLFFINDLVCYNFVTVIL